MSVAAIGGTDLDKLRSRLRFRDVLAVGAVGLRVKRARTTLTALGIAIGIAAMVAVVGISASSRADLLAQLDQLGTNNLKVTSGTSLTAATAELPTTAADMIRRVEGVEAASGTRLVDEATVRRSDHIDSSVTHGISVVATEASLLDTLDGAMAHGTFLNNATSTQHAVVLGSVAAERLGIVDVSGSEGGVMVDLGSHWLKVIGILDPVPLAPDIDRAALIGYDLAGELFDIDRSASTVRVRTDPDRTNEVADLLGPTANPFAPNEVSVSRPTDALAAKAQVNESLQALLLGLGAVALLVGGVGIANVMVISVLERRTEIGVRRALGATRRHIRLQFVVEAMLLAALGGLTGVAIGVGITKVYADSRGWAFSLPPLGLTGGVAVSLAVGAIAGLYPAVRASRLAPAEAVRAN